MPLRRYEMDDNVTSDWVTNSKAKQDKRKDIRIRLRGNECT